MEMVWVVMAACEYHAPRVSSTAEHAQLQVVPGECGQVLLEDIGGCLPGESQYQTLHWKSSRLRPGPPTTQWNMIVQNIRDINTRLGVTSYKLNTKILV